VRVPRWLQPLTLLAAIALLTFVGLMQLSTPSPAPATVPLTEFSAERAMTHLNVIAGSSRAIGLPGHDATREYLVEQLTLMGLQPELQTASALVRFEGADAYSAGMVTNVIARLPGTASTGAVVLNAHYDGGSTGPAAGDNGAAVAATLEIIRAIQAGPALANDLIVVFSDGEENGDLGAAAFNQDHPWANNVRLAINFEAQGSGGPVILYATSDENGWLTSQYFEIAPEASAYSLLPDLVRQLPGMRLACDLEDYLLNGSAGLGFVFASDTPAYHSERDSVQNINRGSIQQEGENTLAVVQHFGKSNLTDMPGASNRVFFNLIPGVVMHYGGGFVLPLALLVTLLTGLVMVGGVRRKLLSAGGLAVGFAALLLGSVLTVAVVALLWIGIRAVNSDYRVLMVGSYQSGLYTVALSLAAIAIMGGIFWLLQRRVRTDNLYGGALLAWLLLTWAVSLVLPGASYLLIWPLLFALAPLAWTVFQPDHDRRSWLHLALLVLALIPAFILIPGTYYQVVALLNRMDYFATVSGSVAMLGLWALFIAPLVGLYLRHLELLSELAGPARRWAAPAAIGVIAVALIVYANATSGFSADHPRPNHIAYEVNADTGQARWVSLDPEPDAWSAQFLTADPASGEYELAPGTMVPAQEAAAPLVPLAMPGAEIISDATADGVRTVTFRLMSPRGAADLTAVIEAEGELLSASLDGRPVDLTDYTPAAEGTLQFGYAGVPATGIELTLSVRSEAPIAISLTETTYGLPEIPGLTVSPRPAGTMPASGLPLDATIVRMHVTI
jgi:hypothetical protein